MKLSKKIKSKITEQLIVRINELYHDFENQLYNLRHPYLFAMETERWKSIASKYIWNDVPKICLDYGTGTGFVPAIICNGLKISDKMVCTDLSQEMLNFCRKELQSYNYNCQLAFRKGDGLSIPAESESVDIITVNSVLHHILDISNFAMECRNVLKSGGVLIAVHEPNKDTRLPFKYRVFVNIIEGVLNPQNNIIKIVEKCEFLEVLLRKILSRFSESYRVRNKFLKEISEILVKENLIDVKLRGVEIQQLVDIQTEEGFLKNELINKFYPSFELVEWETFGYIDINNTKLSNKLNNFFRKKFPSKGRAFYMILRKL